MLQYLKLGQLYIPTLFTILIHLPGATSATFLSRRTAEFGLIGATECPSLNATVFLFGSCQQMIDSAELLFG